MTDPLVPPQQAEAALPRMEAAGLGWLTPILRTMIGGDPWQEGQFAVEITEAWQASCAGSEVVSEALDAYARQNADLHRENILLRDENAALRESTAVIPNRKD